MSKEEFLKLSDLDKVKYAIEESLKEHKAYKSEYWKGSAFMGDSILQTIEQVKKFAIPVVVQVKPKKVCELIRQKFDDWVFGLETQAGEKLKVVDSTDFNEIITEIESELKDL